jgi:PII-like signaling protein
VSSDRLTLTTYFGERKRAGSCFLADALLDIYERHEVQMSVLLRGAEGFGAGHHLRSDLLLTLSEDLPMVSVAVDAPARIEGLLGEVMALGGHGLVTLERARLAGAGLHDEVKLTVYAGREDGVAVCDLLHQRGIAGATVLLGVDGTAHGVRRRARFFGRNAHVPTAVVAVGSRERIAAVLPELEGRLLTVERVRVCKRDGRSLAGPGQDGPLEKLTVYASDHHAELVRRLGEAGARGVTCVRGIWGFHGDHAPHGDRLLQLRRRVPVVTVIVDTPEGIARSFAVVDEATRHGGLVTSELVPRIAPPRASA